MRSTIYGLKVWVTLVLAILTLSIFSGTTLSFAHNFSTNESAMFIALVELIKTEAQLVEDNIANNNMSLAGEHADRAISLLTDNITSEIAERNQRVADELSTTLTTLKTASEAAPGNDTGVDIELVVSDLNAILDEALVTRVDADVLNNSTIQALALVDILDGVLNGYGDAHAVGFDMTDMSSMMGADGSHSMDMGGSTDGMHSMGSNDTSALGMKKGMQPSTGDMKIGLEKGGDSSSMHKDMMASDQGTALVSLADYQTAQLLAMKAQEAFVNQLSNSSSEVQSLDNIASAMQELASTVDSKGSPNDVMLIVHTKLHPNFIEAFGLEIN